MGYQHTRRGALRATLDGGGESARRSARHRPIALRIKGPGHDDGNGLACIPYRSCGLVALCNDELDTQRQKLGGQRGQAVESALEEPSLDNEVAPLPVAQFPESGEERLP